MSCHSARRREPEGLPVAEEQLAALLDLAWQEDEVTFKDLARCLGVAPERVDDLWRGLLRLAQGARSASSLDPGARRKGAERRDG